MKTINLKEEAANKYYNCFAQAKPNTKTDYFLLSSVITAAIAGAAFCGIFVGASTLIGGVVGYCKSLDPVIETSTAKAKQVASQKLKIPTEKTPKAAKSANQQSAKKNSNSLSAIKKIGYIALCALALFDQNVNIDSKLSTEIQAPNPNHTLSTNWFDYLQGENIAKENEAVAKEILEARIKSEENRTGKANHTLPNKILNVIENEDRNPKLQEQRTKFQEKLDKENEVAGREIQEVRIKSEENRTGKANHTLPNKILNVIENEDRNQKLQEQRIKFQKKLDKENEAEVQKMQEARTKYEENRMGKAKHYLLEHVRKDINSEDHAKKFQEQRTKRHYRTET